MNHFLIYGSKLVTDKSLGISSGPWIGDDKSENDELNESALLKVILLDIVTLLVVANSGFGLQRLTGGVSNWLKIANIYERFLQQSGAIFKAEYNFLSIPNRLTKPLGESF